MKNLKETDDADNKTECVLHQLHSDLLRSEGSLHPLVHRSSFFPFTQIILRYEPIEVGETIDFLGPAMVDK